MLVIQERYYQIYIRAVHLQYALRMLKLQKCMQVRTALPQLRGVSILLYAHIASSDTTRFYELGNLFFQALTYGIIMQRSNVYRVRVAARMSIVQVTDAVVTFYYMGAIQSEYVLVRLFGSIAWKQLFFFFDGEYTQSQISYFVDTNVLYAPNLFFLCTDMDASAVYLQQNQFAVQRHTLPMGLLYSGGRNVNAHMCMHAAMTTWGMCVQKTSGTRMLHYTYLKQQLPVVYLIHLLGLGQYEDDDTFRLYHALLARMPFSMEIRPDVGFLNMWYARIVQSYYVIPVV